MAKAVETLRKLGYYIEKVAPTMRGRGQLRPIVGSTLVQHGLRVRSAMVVVRVVVAAVASQVAQVADARAGEVLQVSHAVPQAGFPPETEKCAAEAIEEKTVEALWLMGGTRFGAGRTTLRASWKRLLRGIVAVKGGCPILKLAGIKRTGT